MFAEEVARPLAITKAMSKEQKEWRSQDDARTLADSEVIKADATRLKDAKVAALKIATEDKERAAAMANVAKMRKVKTPADRAEQHDAKRKKSSKPKNVHNVFKRLG